MNKRAKAAAMDMSGLQMAWIVAAMLHLIAFVLFGVLKDGKEETNKFHIVNIRLGGGGQGMKLKKQEAPAPQAPAVQSAPAPTPQPVQAAAPTPTPAPVPAAKPRAPATPAAKPKAKPEAAPWRRERAKDEPVRRSTPRTLAQYVESGVTSLGAESDDAVMQRYTQVLSLWLYKYWESPEGLEVADGMVQAQIRLRIERSGRLLGYRLEQGTGTPALDDAMNRMVRKATPLPEVPKNYPGGTQLEFLIPINITLG